MKSKLILSALIALSFIIPTNCFASDLAGGFHSSGSLIITGKVRAERLAPLHGFFQTNDMALPTKTLPSVSNKRGKTSYFRSGSLVTGGVIGRARTKKALIGFFQNELKERSLEAKSVVDSNGFTNSGSVSLSGTF